jgi:CubicO group peptidase (beta-lactamase class C family)
MSYSRSYLPSDGLWSSASDMSHYLIAQINGGQYGETSILKAESIVRLHEADYEFEPGSGYAMGWLTYKVF